MRKISHFSTENELLFILVYPPTKVHENKHKEKNNDFFPVQKSDILHFSRNDLFSAQKLSLCTQRNNDFSGAPMKSLLHCVLNFLCVVLKFRTYTANFRNKKMLTFSVLKIDKYSIFMNRKFPPKERGFTPLEISYNYPKTTNR